MQDGLMSSSRIWAPRSLLVAGAKVTDECGHVEGIVYTNDLTHNNYISAAQKGTEQITTCATIDYCTRRERFSSASEAKAKK